MRKLQITGAQLRAFRRFLVSPAHRPDLRRRYGYDGGKRGRRRPGGL